MTKARLWRLAALIGVTTACASGHQASPAAQTPWTGATALSAVEDHPFGVVVHGTDVIYTTGLIVPGDHAVRIAPLEPATPAASRILAADPGGKVPNGALALDATDVYLAAGASVARVSIATGESALLAKDRPSSVRTVAVDDRYVWWTTSGYKDFKGGEVARIPKHGGAVEILAAGTDDAGHVYQDEPARQAVAIPHTSYFDDIVLDGASALVSSPQAILRVGAGGHPTVVADEKTLGGSPAYIAADADRIYAEVAGGNNLVSVPRSGGSRTELSPDADNTMDFKLTGDEVVFITTGSFNGDAAVRAVPKTGGAARILTSGHYAHGDLTIAGNRVVFSADGRVWSAPLRGG